MRSKLEIYINDYIINDVMTSPDCLSPYKI